MERFPPLAMFSVTNQWLREWKEYLVHSVPLGTNLALHTFGTVVFRLISAALIFLVNLLLANQLGVLEYGLWSYVLSWQILLSQLCLLGLDRLFVRLVSHYKSSGTWAVLGGLLCWGNSVTILISLAGIGGLFLLSSLMHAAGTAPWQLVVKVAVFLVPLTILLKLQQSALQGLNRVLAGQAPELIVYPCLLFFLLGSSFLSGMKTTLNFVVTAYVLATGIAASVAIMMLVQSLPKAVTSINPIFHSRDWFMDAIPMFLIGGLDVLISQVDILMLGAMRGPKQVGIYAAASRGARIISLVLNSVNIAMAPVIAELYSSGNMKKLQRLVTHSARFVLLTAATATAIMFFWGKYFLVLFGKDFVTGYGALMFLCAGQLVNAAMGSVGYLLIMTGHGRDAATGLGVGVAVNIILNALLIPVWGIEGAALSFVLGQIIWNGILAWRVWVRLKMISTAWGNASYGGR